MAALNKNGIIRAIPLKDAIMKAACSKTITRTRMYCCNKAFYSPLPLESGWRRGPFLRLRHKNKKNPDHSK